MSKEKKAGMPLKSLDDLFSTQAERDNGKINDVQDIDISLIDDFPDHPFQVRDDEEMEKLVESVKAQGVLYPALVRPKENGRYELIAGHRRKHASIIAERPTLRCMICDYDNDTATIVMVDSNIQRETILPSERAKAYKMKLDALNHRGMRTDLTYSPMDNKLEKKTSAQELAENTGKSQAQIYRYVRLNELVPELLELVDDGKIGLRPAYELSFLDVDSQKELAESIDIEQCTPSHAQAIQMKKAYKEGTLTSDVISYIMQQEKPNQKERVSISADRIRKFIPKTVPFNKTEEFICKAVEYYSNHLRAKERNDQAR